MSERSPSGAHGRPTAPAQVSDQKQFIFVDESGDPGPSGDPYYILAAIHMSEAVLHHVRFCDAAFRYHSQIVKEYKDQQWAKGIGQAGHRLLLGLADLTAPDQVTATVNWLDKGDYTGPHLAPGKSMEFRHFQIRMLLEHHATIRPWSSRVDLVLDRWDASTSGRRNLEDYLRGNYRLRPQIETVTFVDSVYADMIQIADLYTRLARLMVNGTATSEHVALAARLFTMNQVRKGVY